MASVGLWTPRVGFQFYLIDSSTHSFVALSKYIDFQFYLIDSQMKAIAHALGYVPRLSILSYRFMKKSRAGPMPPCTLILSILSYRFDEDVTFIATLVLRLSILSYRFQTLA